MERGGRLKKETMFLRIAVILMGVPVLGLAALITPEIITQASTGSQAMARVLYGLLTVMALTLPPFFFAIAQALRLLRNIDEDQAFSESSVMAVRLIKRAATVIAGLYVLALPLFYIIGEVDDAPGVIIIGLGLIFAPSVVAVFAAVLQKLLRHALDMKNEQDLTI